MGELGAKPKSPALSEALNDEYRKWHPMKTWITDPQAGAGQIREPGAGRLGER